MTCTTRLADVLSSAPRGRRCVSQLCCRQWAGQRGSCSFIQYCRNHTRPTSPTPSSPPARPRSGDCRLGVNEATCTPRLQHWKNAALTYAALEGGQPLDLSGMECALPKPDIDINTTTAGGEMLGIGVATSRCHQHHASSGELSDGRELSISRQQYAGDWVGRPG